MLMKILIKRKRLNELRELSSHPEIKPRIYRTKMLKYKPLTLSLTIFTPFPLIIEPARMCS